LYSKKENNLWGGSAKSQPMEIRGDKAEKKERRLSAEKSLFGGEKKGDILRGGNQGSAGESSFAKGKNSVRRERRGSPRWKRR